MRLGRASFYGMTYHLRGRAACTNNLFIPMELANEEVLKVFERDVMNHDVTMRVVRKALAKFRAAEQGWKERRQTLLSRSQPLMTRINSLCPPSLRGGHPTTSGSPQVSQ